MRIKSLLKRSNPQSVREFVVPADCDITGLARTIFVIYGIDKETEYSLHDSSRGLKSEGKLDDILVEDEYRFFVGKKYELEFALEITDRSESSDSPFVARSRGGMLSGSCKDLAANNRTWEELKARQNSFYSREGKGKFNEIVSPTEVMLNKKLKREFGGTLVVQRKYVAPYENILHLKSHRVLQELYDNYNDEYYGYFFRSDKELINEIVSEHIYENFLMEYLGECSVQELLAFIELMTRADIDDTRRYTLISHISGFTEVYLIDKYSLFVAEEVADAFEDMEIDGEITEFCKRAICFVVVSGCLRLYGAITKQVVETVYRACFEKYWDENMLLKFWEGAYNYLDEYSVEITGDIIYRANELVEDEAEFVVKKLSENVFYIPGRKELEYISDFGPVSNASGFNNKLKDVYKCLTFRDEFYLRREIEDIILNYLHAGFDVCDIVNMIKDYPVRVKNEPELVRIIEEAGALVRKSSNNGFTDKEYMELKAGKKTRPRLLNAYSYDPCPCGSKKPAGECCGERWS